MFYCDWVQNSGKSFAENFLEPSKFQIHLIDLYPVENVTLICLGPGKTNFIAKINRFLLVFNGILIMGYGYFSAHS